MTGIAVGQGRLELVQGAMTQQDLEAIGNPAIAPRPSAVDGMVEQQRSGGRDVAPLGAVVQVSRDTWKVSGIQSPKSLCDFRGPRAPRPAVYNRRGGLPVGLHADNTRLAGGGGGDGAIHRAGGPAILQELMARYPNGCPTGGAGRGEQREGGRQRSGQSREEFEEGVQLTVQH